MLLQQSIIGNSRNGRLQFEEVQLARNAYSISEQIHAATLSRLGSLPEGVTVNGGLIPRDVYQEFDNVTVERFREDDGDVFLNDLLALSKSVSIGKLVTKFRRASDAGNAQTSMTGQIGVRMDQVEYSYDGTVVPVHDSGFGRNWREFNAQSSEGFDALIDDQRESVASVRVKLADSFMDGHKDNQGNVIVVDALSWSGMRNDTRVAQIDLGAGGINFDFTDTTKTGAENKAAFVQVRNVMWIDNKCSKDLTVYVSKAIASNWERKFSTQYDAKTIDQEIANMMGVKEVKVTSKLTGNEMMGFPLDSSSVRPVVGMGLNTVAMPRHHYNSNYDFSVWGAIGFEVRTDYNSLTCAFMAQA